MAYSKNSDDDMALQVERLSGMIASADAVLVGAGAGLSASAGYVYGGERFHRLFADFEAAFGFHDMYSGGFYPFPDEETRWAYWSRFIMCNRYDQEPGQPYIDLHTVLEGERGDADWFVLTTNVDNQFQISGFPKNRLFCTQGDYGLFQCSRPCSNATYDNEETVRRMAAEQSGMRVPAELLPRCPRCGAPMTMNLRADSTFVEDAGWHAAQERYLEFLRRHEGLRVLFFELGVGFNSPGIIKYPFWRMAYSNPKSMFACVNMDEPYLPRELEDRVVDGSALGIGADLGEVLHMLAQS